MGYKVSHVKCRLRLIKHRNTPYVTGLVVCVRSRPSVTAGRPPAAPNPTAPTALRTHQPPPTPTRQYHLGFFFFFWGGLETPEHIIALESAQCPLSESSCEAQVWHWWPGGNMLTSTSSNMPESVRFHAFSCKRPSTSLPGPRLPTRAFPGARFQCRGRLCDEAGASEGETLRNGAPQPRFR